MMESGRARAGEYNAANRRGGGRSAFPRGPRSNKLQQEHGLHELEMAGLYSSCR